MHNNEMYPIGFCVHVCICLLPSQHMGEPAELESSSVSNGIDVPNYSPPSNSNGRLITVSELHKSNQITYSRR